MRHEADAVWNVLGATALLGLIAGLAVFAAGFLLIWAGASVAADAGWLPDEWNPVRTRDLAIASALVALPLTVAAAVWVHRFMLAGERAFIRAEREY